MHYKLKVIFEDPMFGMSLRIQDSDAHKLKMGRDS